MILECASAIVPDSSTLFFIPVTCRYTCWAYIIYCSFRCFFVCPHNLL